MVSVDLFAVLWWFDGAMMSQVCGLLLVDKLIPKVVVRLFGVFEEAASGSKANNLPEGSIAHEVRHNGALEYYLSGSGVIEEERFLGLSRTTWPNEDIYTWRCIFVQTLRGIEPRSDLEYRH